MLPFLALAAMYLAGCVALAVTGRNSPPRLFLAHAMAVWSIYWMAVWAGWGDITIRHVLGRWLHVPLVAASLLIAYGQWYADRGSK